MDLMLQRPDQPTAILLIFITLPVQRLLVSQLKVWADVTLLQAATIIVRKTRVLVMALRLTLQDRLKFIFPILITLLLQTLIIRLRLQPIFTQPLFTILLLKDQPTQLLNITLPECTLHPPIIHRQQDQITQLPITI